MRVEARAVVESQAPSSTEPTRADASQSSSVVGKTLKQLPDGELVRRLLAGDESLFEALVDRYHASLVRLARAFVSSQAVAEEVAQETWMAVLKGLPRFEGRASLKNWLFRILSNRAKTRGVREGRTIPFTAMGSGDAGDAVDADRFGENGSWFNVPRPWLTQPDRRLLDAEVRRLVEEAIEELPDKQRAVITMRDIEGFSSKDVQDYLDVSETYQRVLLHRARTKVRAALEPYLSD